MTWTPLLTDEPEAAAPILKGVRLAIPQILIAFEARRVTASTTPVISEVSLGSGKPTLRFSLSGREFRRATLGARDCMVFDIVGEAAPSQRDRFPIAGHCVVDLATKCLLEVRLTAPVAA
jgi:hypothetical protein